ncbi:MAG: TetR family transcriptional regulator [Microthrixaceae bacterium]
MRTTISTATTDRRQAILDAATTLMAEAGSRGTTIAAVAERAGMTDAGVLYHFRSKQDLLLAVIEQFDRDIERVLEHQEGSGIELLRALRDWGVGMELVPEIQSLLIVLTTEHLHAEGAARDYLRRRYRRTLDRLRTAFADAAEGGDLRANLDPDQEASAFVAFLDGIRLQWFLLDGSVSMADSVRTYVEHTLDRLAPQKDDR